MKKLISLFILASFLILSLPAFASESVVNLSVGNINAGAGEVVELPVMLTGCQGFSNISFEIEYDNTALELLDVENGCAGALLTMPQSITANPYNLIWNSDKNVVFNGTIATLQFKVAEDANGIYPVKISFYAGRNGNQIDGYHGNYDANFNSLGMTYTDGSISVEEADANEPSGAYVEVLGKNAIKGKSVDVEVELKNCAGFSNLALEFGYDSSVFNLKGITTDIPGTTVSQSETTDNNPYNILWYSEANTVFNGKIVTLHFDVSKDAEYGEYPITVSHYKGRNNTYVDGYHVNFDVNMESLKLSYISGIVDVKPEKHELSASLLKTEDGIRLDVSSASPNEEEGGVIVAALYENHSLLKMMLVEDNKALLEDKGDMIKVMWWNSLESCMPYAEPVELEIPEA